MLQRRLKVRPALWGAGFDLAPLREPLESGKSGSLAHLSRGYSPVRIGRCNQNNTTLPRLQETWPDRRCALLRFTRRPCGIDFVAGDRFL